MESYAAQRIGSPAADLNKTRLHKIAFSTKWPPLFHAEGGQVGAGVRQRVLFFHIPRVNVSLPLVVVLRRQYHELGLSSPST
jgi:hypothetical protein